VDGLFLVRPILVVGIDGLLGDKGIPGTVCCHPGGHKLRKEPGMGINPG